MEGHESQSANHSLSPPLRPQLSAAKRENQDPALGADRAHGTPPSGELELLETFALFGFFLCVCFVLFFSFLILLQMRSLRSFFFPSF